MIYELNIHIGERIPQNTTVSNCVVCIHPKCNTIGRGVKYDHQNAEHDGRQYVANYNLTVIIN